MRLWLIVKWLCKCTLFSLDCCLFGSWQVSQHSRCTYARSNIIFTMSILTHKRLLFSVYAVVFVFFRCRICLLCHCAHNNQHSTTIANVTNGVSVQIDKHFASFTHIRMHVRSTTSNRHGQIVCREFIQLVAQQYNDRNQSSVYLLFSTFHLNFSQIEFLIHFNGST